MSLVIALLAFLLFQTSQATVNDGLFQAIHRADTEAIKRILDDGGDPNAVDSEGVPALMAATLFAGPDAVNLLLDRGASANAATSNGATALMWAMPDQQKAKVLVAHGANVNAKATNAMGRTSLLIAAGMPGSVEILRFLLEHGADLHAKLTNGTGALHQAAASADVDVVRFLVERGLGVNESGTGGALPLGGALTRQYLPTIEFLLSKGARIREMDFIRGTYWLRPDLVARLLDAGGNVNASGGPYTVTPLIYAVSSEQRQAGVVELLLDRGADPNQADSDGERPLDWAMHRSDKSTIEVLKQHGGMDAITPRDKTFARPEGVVDAQTSVARSLALLLPSGPVVFEKRGCISCHNQFMPLQATAIARERGIAVDETMVKKNLDQILMTYKRIGEQAMLNVETGGARITMGYAAMSLAAQKHPMDHMTAGLTHVVASRQLADGSWPAIQTRPPLEYSTITDTALAVRTLTLYPIEGQRQDLDLKIRRAHDWLLTAKPQSAEEHAMRLMGLAWSKGSRNELNAAARECAAQQRSDGGWTQLPHLPTDAYATGIILYALHEAGTPVTDNVYRSGVQFLLTNQYSDGSWFVKTRSFPVQPQFESGYPFGYNQWISAAGASWATMAIAYTLPSLRR